MDVATLRMILEHLPDDLEVHIAGRGPVGEVRRHEHQRWVQPHVFLDVGESVRVVGRFRDARTLAVRLEAVTS